MDWRTQGVEPALRFLIEWISLMGSLSCNETSPFSEFLRHQTCATKGLSDWRGEFPQLRQLACCSDRAENQVKIQTLSLQQHWERSVLPGQPGALPSGMVELTGGLWGQACLLERCLWVPAASCAGALCCPGTPKPGLLLPKKAPRANNPSWAAKGDVWGQSALKCLFRLNCLV